MPKFITTVGTGRPDMSGCFKRPMGFQLATVVGAPECPELTDIQAFLPGSQPGFSGSLDPAAAADASLELAGAWSEPAAGEPAISHDLSSPTHIPAVQTAMHNELLQTPEAADGAGTSSPPLPPASSLKKSALLKGRWIHVVPVCQPQCAFRCYGERLMWILSPISNSFLERQGQIISNLTTIKINYISTRRITSAWTPPPAMPILDFMAAVVGTIEIARQITWRGFTSTHDYCHSWPVLVYD